MAIAGWVSFAWRLVLPHRPSRRAALSRGSPRIKNARVIAADSVCRGKLNLNHRIEVRDEHEHSVGTIYFRDVVKIETLGETRYSDFAESG